MLFVSLVINIYSLLSFFSEQWHELPNFPNPNKWGYSLVSLNNDVYVTGGSGVCGPNVSAAPLLTAVILL